MIIPSTTWYFTPQGIDFGTPGTCAPFSISHIQLEQMQMCRWWWCGRECVWKRQCTQNTCALPKTTQGTTHLHHLPTPPHDLTFIFTLTWTHPLCILYYSPRFVLQPSPPHMCTARASFSLPPLQRHHAGVSPLTMPGPHCPCGTSLAPHQHLLLCPKWAC